MFKSIVGHLSSGSFDWASALWGALALPILAAIGLVVRRFFIKVGTYAVNGFLFAIGRTINHRLAAILSIRDYCKLQLAGRSKYLNVPGISDVNIPLDDVFVPLVLEQGTTKSAYDHDTLLGAGNRLRIIGDPGSGKSSIAKKIFRDECRRRTRFPILIELRKVNVPSVKKMPSDWLFKYIRAEVSKVKAFEVEKCFDAYSNSAGLLVILDGMDEVSSVSFPIMQQAINDLSVKLSGRSPNNVVVLSMRTQYHSQVRHFFTTEYPTVLSLKRFTPSDIYIFLTRWPFPEGQKAENIVRIYTDLTDRPNLREMCTNPLVLSMYVAQDQAMGYVIAPESRTDFYIKVTDELLVKRRVLQTGNTEAISALRQNRQRILGAIAFHHLVETQNPANVVPWKGAVKIVERLMKLNLDDAERHLRDISRETGIISEEQERESLRFIHLTFCEFFAAFEAAQGRSDGWSKLISKHRQMSENLAPRSRLAEVISFATALVPIHRRDQCIDEVAESGDSNLLALAFLETKRYEHPLWAMFAERREGEFLSREELSWDSDWLRELHLFLVVVSDYERTRRAIRGEADEARIANFFKRLSANSQTAIHRLIRGYAEQDAAAAFRVATLCNVDVLQSLPDMIVENCDQPQFLAIAVRQAGQDGERAGKWAALFAEAGLRSRAAAACLMARSEKLSARVERQGRIGYVRPSLYSDVLAIGLETLPLGAQTPILSALAPILKNKYRLFRAAFLNSLIFVCLAIVGMLAPKVDGAFRLMVDFVWEGQSKHWADIVRALSILAGLIVAYLLALRLMSAYFARRYLYKRLFNVPVDTQGVLDGLVIRIGRIRISTRDIEQAPRVDSRAALGRLEGLVLGKAEVVGIQSVFEMREKYSSHRS